MIGIQGSRPKKLRPDLSGILIGDPRIRGILTGLPGEGSASLLLPPLSDNDPSEGVLFPMTESGSRKTLSRRLAFIAKGRKLDPRKVVSIPGKDFDWWTKLPPEWGNPHEIHPMIHTLGALVPVLKTLPEAEREEILAYPLPAMSETGLEGVALVILAQNFGMVFWKDSAFANSEDAFGMGRRPILDRIGEILSRSGESLSREEILWIRDRRNTNLPFWSFLSDRSMDAPFDPLSRALEHPPLVYDSPVVRSRRSGERFKKFGPSLLVFVLVLTGIWYYENIFLAKDPRSIEALETARTLLSRNLESVKTEKTILQNVTESVQEKPWDQAASLLEYLSGGLTNRSLSLRVDTQKGFVWELSGTPLPDLSIDDVRSGVQVVGRSMHLHLPDPVIRANERLSFSLDWQGNGSDLGLDPEKRKGGP